MFLYKHSSTICLLLITSQHQELLKKYEQLLVRSLQFDAFLKQKDNLVQQQQSQITPLKNAVEQLIEEVKLLREENAALVKSNKEKDKRIEKLELIEYQYQQLTKLVFSRSSEKSTIAVSGQLPLGLEADVVEACNINTGQKIEGYTKIKSEKKKHPGRNEIPAHIERKYIDMHPDNLPSDAELFDTVETEQLEYDPARLFATVYRRHKYKRNTSDHVTHPSSYKIVNLLVQASNINEASPLDILFCFAWHILSNMFISLYSFAFISHGLNLLI
jgi:hypothetical protein